MLLRAEWNEPVGESVEVLVMKQSLRECALRLQGDRCAHATLRSARIVPGGQYANL